MKLTKVKLRNMFLKIEKESNFEYNFILNEVRFLKIEDLLFL